MAKTEPTTPEKVVQLISISQIAMTKAAQIEKAAEQTKQAVAAKIPAAVKALVENERIGDHQKQAAEDALRDHAQCLDIILKLASHRNAAEVQQLGTPITSQPAIKVASNSLTNAYVGRRSDELKESDLALFRGLGLPVPTS